MPLKILLADDSMTAQKMGKEILLGAGYEVIAVSNGAAAAKKLAEKPDICILDIIMPGYTGLEICERIRNSIDTAKMPVLLTVGKMEHFDQKDVQRVAADGVIIKPFEASDLLATIQKFVERLNAPKAAAAAASREKTIAFTPPNVEEFKDDSYNQWKTEAEVHDETTGEIPASKKSFEISAEAAAAPAFFDEEPAAPPAIAETSGTSRDKTVLMTPPNFAGPSAAAAPAPAVAFAPAVPSETSAPAFDMSAAAPAMDFSPAPPTFDDTMQFAPSQFIETVSSTATGERPAIEFTAHAAVEVNPPIVGGYEATAHAPVEVGQSLDPALVTGTEGFDSFKTKVGTDEPQAPSIAPSDDDFEARVAAAMTGYGDLSHAAVEAMPHAAVPESVVEVERDPEHERTQKITAIREIEPTPAPVIEAAPAIETVPEIETASAYSSAPIVEETAADTTAVPEGMMNAALVEAMQAAVSDMPVAAPSVEDTQVIEVQAETAPTVEIPHQDIELAKALAAAVGGDVPATVATALSDHPQEVHEIAHTVTRVFERMLPDIMEEVKKELVRRGKK